MVVFPNAKINLGLNIINKRSDGYHELETCFYPVPWTDALEIIEANETIVTTSGIEIPKDGDNIVLKAYQLLADIYDLPPVQIHLHKAIPIGAGLGGGSSDAAFTLRLINDLFTLGIDDEQLMTFAVQLGADCAFFIMNKPSLALGIGEKLTTINLALAGKFILLVYPNIHISTKVAFSDMSPRIPSVKIADTLKIKETEKWKKNLVNDFEKPLFTKFPILSDIKKNLYNAGARYASMSGSGSSMYGIFDHETTIDFPKEYKIWSGTL